MHRKRISAPRSWSIHKKKKGVWVTDPKSPHPRELSMPVNIVLRDVVGIVNNNREVKKIISEQGLLVDGRPVSDPDFGVGLFDVISLPNADLHLRVSVDNKNRLIFVEIGEEESKYKLCRVDDKRSVDAETFQVSLHDGRNIRMNSEDASDIGTGDTLKVKLPEQEVLDHFKFEEGVPVFVFSGSHAGKVATLSSYEVMRNPTPNVVKLESDEDFSTIDENIIVVGQDELEVTVGE